jgi:hypothetical protein
MPRQLLRLYCQFTWTYSQISVTSTKIPINTVNKKDRTLFVTLLEETAIVRQIIMVLSAINTVSPRLVLITDLAPTLAAASATLTIMDLYAMFTATPFRTVQ